MKKVKEKLTPLQVKEMREDHMTWMEISEKDGRKATEIAAECKSRGMSHKQLNMDKKRFDALD